MTQPPVGQQERRHGREEGKLRRHRQTVMDGWVNWQCQDRLAPKRCVVRPNATTAQPENGARHRIPCRSPHQRS
ncbi:hypothetical protein [Pectobacterium brasiliense]|uniref:hypothetical protein n=1 Tax=Pectobacterium brasiliense TaxID=180957 RepID=UPI001F21B6DD|nr:hypothetical protein [Pectobacterium brasiliense]